MTTHAILFTPGNVDARTRKEFEAALPATWHFFGARAQLTRAKLGATAEDRIVLCGWSAGGHMVRDTMAALELGERDAIVVGDGVHIREEPGSSMPRAPWQAAIDRARVGEGPRVLLSHTYLTYTDTMRDDPRTPAVERAYQSTATSLRTLTTWALEEPTGEGGMVMRSAGRLSVLSYESSVYDAAEHARHLHMVMPEMLARIDDGGVDMGAVAARLAVAQSADEFELGALEVQSQGTRVFQVRSGTLPTPAWDDELPTWRDPTLTLAQRMVSWIGAQLYLAPREIPGARHEPRIVAYGEHCRRGGTWRGAVEGWTPEAKRVSSATDEEAWCAKLQSAALVASWLPGDALPFCPRVSVAELYRDAVAAKTWQPAGSGYVPLPGELAILARAGGDPTRGGSGHVRMCASVDLGDTYRGVGGNEKDRIVDAVHSLSDPDLRGWIRVG